MAVKRKYRLNLRNYGNLPAIMLSQYDEGYALEFEIRDGVDAASDLSAYTVTLKGTRADTLAYSFNGTISSNVLTFVIDTTMTACAGRGTAEIAIKDTANDVLFATFNMPVFVERAAVPEGSIDADVERAQEIAEQIQEIVNTAAAEVKGEAESWAVGQRDGTDVPATDPTYHNNAKYYSEQAQQAADSIGIDATLTQAGKAADAKKTGDEISDLKSGFSDLKEDLSKSVIGVEASDSANDHQTYIPCEDGSLNSANISVKKVGKTLFVSNGVPTSALLRYCIYGTFAMVAKAPSYANVPTWYHDPLPSFTVGHEYKFDYKLVSGTIDHLSVEGDLYFDLRNRSGGSEQIGVPSIWTCTFQPEMVAFCLRQFSYNDALIYVSIVDLTEVESEEPLASIEARVEELEAESDSTYTVPSFFESQLATAILKINTDINSDKTAGTYGTDIESFVFITDVHWAENKKHSPGLIRRVLNNTPVQTVICGGDFINASNATKAGAVGEIRDFTTAITEIPCYDYFCVFGNHDANTNGGSPVSVQFTKQEQYDLLYRSFADKTNVHWIWEDMPSVMNTEPVKNDYYVDHARAKTRYLCLDWNNPMNGDRATWITSVLAKNDGYRVVIIYHGIYAVDSGGALTPEHVTIMTLAEPYKNKVVALVTGHAHVDAVVDYYGDGSVPVIITACDTFRSERMTEGTLDEQCFDVCVIDYGQSKIKLTRIGRGSDREVNISMA